jgi:hypothetical protein
VHILESDSPRLPQISDSDPSVPLDSVARNLRPVYASLLDQGVPEHLAALSWLLNTPAPKPLSDEPRVWNSPVRTTAVALMPRLTLLALLAALEWAFKSSSKRAPAGNAVGSLYPRN